MEVTWARPQVGSCILAPTLPSPTAGEMKVKWQTGGCCEEGRPQRRAVLGCGLSPSGAWRQPTQPHLHICRVDIRLGSAGQGCRGHRGPEGPGQVNSPSAGGPQLTAGWGVKGEASRPGSKAALMSPGPMPTCLAGGLDGAHYPRGA